MNQNQYEKNLEQLLRIAEEQMHIWCRANWSSRIEQPKKKFLNEMPIEAIMVYYECIIHDSTNTLFKLEELCDRVNSSYGNINVISFIRKEVGLSQAQLADIIGCSRQSLVSWEEQNEQPPKYYRDALFYIKQNI